MTLIRALSTAVAALVGVALIGLAVFVVGVRTRHPGVLRFARVVQRDMLNPGALRDAGSPGSPWAIVRVAGRVSGKVYDTPVGVTRAGDELYITLPYGEGTQWLRNVLAAGRATVLCAGEEIDATRPNSFPSGRRPSPPAIASPSRSSA
ncbi:nitroreductase/quinone reductase family protein [Microbacterium sp. LRZ72]|uniref:nitroreductase/quinone reductase family protein n=1 Tax=Microbacterium sp. LRZ72 TaxID=2942481 RepID=UPI0029B59843|nr:nitroreductase/quinone reductase family protein [Microbacterium sp. LRZ72]MDX2376174.1 nitroreductase/quinone reductase family protein [Microbacterium sp. LRZ72]